jgi:purine-nucleoside phosphorylase
VSTHIGAQSGQIAPVVLLPGDPKRAQWIAETFLDDATCYSEVRGMLGFTGSWRGTPISVQGSGMGQPSMAIYVNELFSEYDVASIIRVGSCGGLSDKVAIRDVILASGACTDSAMNRITFEGFDYAPVADFGLMRAAVEAAEATRRDAATHVGLLFSADMSFYASREVRSSVTRDLHRLRPRRHRGGDDGPGAGADVRRHGGHRPHGSAHNGLNIPSSSTRPGRSPGSTTRPLRTK